MMNVEAALELVNRAVYRHTEKHLTDLQQAVVANVLERRKYWEIADSYGCTEGHAKDTGSLLWKLLSQVWETKVTKSNLRSVVSRQLLISESGNEIAIAKTSVNPITDKADFVGRQEAIASLQALVARGNKIIVIQGEGGVGKTTLAQKLLSHLDCELNLEVLMAKETVNIVPVASVVEEWLQRDLDEDSGKEFGVTLARLKRCLEENSVGILIDNLEPALDKNGRFIAECRNYLELLRILGDSKVQSTTIITSRDRLCEADLPLEHYRLTGLELSAWKQYFSAQQLDPGSVLGEIQHTYGGNAKAMGMLCGIVREDYDGDLVNYWQENRHDPLVETDLTNLVASQFNRLQQLDSQAYSLLCRLGCYRYQDVATVPLAGVLCLLWDIPTRQRRVIKSLRNRSLLEFDRGKYWLHPTIQAEAKLRLQSHSADWCQTQSAIANFLTQSITRIDNIQDGLTALEAYYHYTAIADYAAAAKVILYSRENQWGQYLTLGTTLYRLGIIEPLSIAISQIIDRIEHSRHRSELNNILGDLYWTTGKVHRAIAIGEQTIATSRHTQQTIPPTQENRHDLYYWRMLEVDSLLSLGLYNIDLWELDTAADLFQQAIDLAHNTKHHAWAEKASLGLALVNSWRQSSTDLDPTVFRIYRLIINLEDPAYNTGRFAYFMQMLGQILFNQQDISSAHKIWQRAIAFSQSSHYTQIKAKALIGLGNIARANGNTIEANIHHQRAVELLEKIAAKCDLAEAYFQWGLTLHDRSLTQSNNCFQKAIAIYKQIPAPKQIERISSAS